MTRWALVPLLWLAGVAASCERRGAPTAPDAAPAGSAAAVEVPEADRAARSQRLLTAEHRRTASEVTPEDTTSRDVVVRRLAARALARIADEPSAKKLVETLADEDHEVVAWSAYGLGYACKGRESTTVRALVTRAAALAAEEPPPADPPAALDPWSALADGLGRCATTEAEATLRGWLEQPERAEAASLSLGRLASKKKRLEDASIVALLDAASRPERPVAGALLAFTRLQGLGEATQARLLEVATEALAAPPGARRAFAIRALGRAGPKAVEQLAKIVTDAGFGAAEQADAARELAKHGEAGQRALATLLGVLAPNDAERDKLTSSAWGPLITTLEALELPARDAKGTLERLARAELPDSGSPTLRRRVVTMRCRAATLLAPGPNPSPHVLACDPDPDGALGQLALLRVLDRGKLTGARHGRWKTLTEAKAPTVRQAAIELMAKHPEIPRPYEVLARALRAPDAGTVSAAAQILAAYPDRAAERAAEPKPGSEAKPKADGTKPALPAPAAPPAKPHPSVVDALTSAFALQRAPDAVEVAAALMGAAGALQLLSFKPKLETYCASDNPSLREHAEKALRVLGEQKRSCAAAGPGKAPPELGALRPSELSLVFETDAGEVELTLEPALAPVTVARLAALASSGFFDGNVIHRVVPGFVVQLGDPGADGYGGAGKEPLRCETSPVPFETGRVGVALAGRDTGSSQFFVTLGPFPHLDGDYALIGRAKPGWDRIAQGDVVRKVRVLP